MGWFREKKERSGFAMIAELSNSLLRDDTIWEVRVGV